MEKWKLIVIVLLLGGLAGYGFYQQNVPPAPPQPDPNSPQPTPRPANARILKLQGKPAPAWSFDKKLWVNTPAPITPAQVKGNVVLLEFWRMGCHHCEQSVPFLNALNEKYSSRGVKLVTVHSPGAPGPDNPENDWTKVQQSIKDWGIKYPVAFDEGGKLFKETYGGDTYPTMLLLNRSGQIVYISSGHTAEKEVQLVQEIEKVLKQY